MNVEVLLIYSITFSHVSEVTVLLETSIMELTVSLTHSLDFSFSFC